MVDRLLPLERVSWLLVALLPRESLIFVSTEIVQKTTIAK